jgi:hypothetical protein
MEKLVQDFIDRRVEENGYAGATGALGYHLAQALKMLAEKAADGDIGSDVFLGITLGAMTK